MLDLSMLKAMSSSSKEKKKYVKVYSNNNLLKTIQVENFDKCYVNTQESRQGCGVAIVDGILYYLSGGTLLKVNNDTNWKQCSGASGKDWYCYAIKNDTSIYEIGFDGSSSFTVTKRTANPVTGWTKVTGTDHSNRSTIATGMNSNDRVYTLRNIDDTYNPYSGITDITGSVSASTSTHIYSLLQHSGAVCYRDWRYYSKIDWSPLNTKGAKYIASSTTWNDWSFSIIRSDNTVVIGYGSVSSPNMGYTTSQKFKKLLLGMKQTPITTL